MVSVIITTYKREPPLLERAINSVLCQTYKDVEIIIVDDSPADYAYREEVAGTIYAYKKTNPDINIHYIQQYITIKKCVKSFLSFFKISLPEWFLSQPRISCRGFF